MHKAVKLSVYIGVVGCWWLISLSVVRSGIVDYLLWKSAPSSASEDYSTT